MIFSIKIVKSLYEVLYMLNKNNENYAYMYKNSKISHETLQTALKYLRNKGFVTKKDKGHKKSFYEISERGKKYFSVMKELKELS